MAKLIPLRLIPDNTNINFMEIRKFNFFISSLLILISLISITFYGLNFGIDFTGGVLIEAKLESKPDLLELYKVTKSLNLGDIQIQDFENNHLMIKIGGKSQEQLNTSQIIEQIKKLLNEKYSEKVEFRKIDYVGPQIGSELIKKGLLAVILSFIAILLYVAFRFEWQYGIGIIIALIHDAIVTLGMMSVTKLEVDLTSIAAILTIIGYSVNDSVVIYDRIRENFKKFKKLEVSEIINLSINETLSRTILTVVTTLLSVLALIISGGPALSSFSITVFVGIIIGTYSSIYISAPILIYFGLKKFLRYS